MRSYALSEGACLAQNSSTNSFRNRMGRTNKMSGLKSRPHPFCYRSDYRVNVFRYLRWAFI